MLINSFRALGKYVELKKRLKSEFNLGELTMYNKFKKPEPSR